MEGNNEYLANGHFGFGMEFMDIAGHVRSKVILVTK